MFSKSLENFNLKGSFYTRGTPPWDISGPKDRSQLCILEDRRSTFEVLSVLYLALVGRTGGDMSWNIQNSHGASTAHC